VLTEDDTGKMVPTISGILMACDRPDLYLPNAFIQAVCYRGTTRNADYQVDAEDIFGPINRQVAEACRFVEKNMKTAARKSPAREEVPQYSINAVFEALVNAVAHRDYSIQNAKIRLHMYADRLELCSPGIFPNTMTVESLALRQATRNELLTSLLARCPLERVIAGSGRSFLMDKRGEGVPIILSESAKLSGVSPHYQSIDDSEVLLTIFAAMPGKKDRKSVSE
jgi:ATP-dependent DNA helicase RecG